MSFILDALKKSETERQRSSGPALFEVKVAAPQARLPAWALIVGALLAINLVILMWVLLRRGKAPEEAPASAQSVSSVPAAASPAGLAPAGAATPYAAPRVTAPSAETGAGPGALPGAAPARAAGTAAAADTPTVTTAEPGANPADERPAVLPGSAEAVAAARERARAQRALEEDAERVRLQLQATAATAGAARREPAVMARTAGLPTRDELVNSGRARIPELTLSLHAYDPDPARRFVFINGSRAREGDAVASGVVLEAITRDGAILSSGGQKFVLTVQ